MGDSRLKAFFAVVALTGAPIVFFTALHSTAAASLGPLTLHMTSHVLLMNLIAPVTVLLVITMSDSAAVPPARGMLAVATLSQIVVLWCAHLPRVMNATLAMPGLHAGLQIALCAVAIWFWWAILAQPTRQQWRSLFALLVTGKLFCLLGALFVFSPRPIYSAAAAAGHAHRAGADALSDHQLAGLIMLTACPLSYIFAGIVIAARWFHSTSVREDGSPAQTPALIRFRGSG